jgi:hypothetical protein
MIGDPWLGSPFKFGANVSLRVQLVIFGGETFKG